MIPQIILTEDDFQLEFVTMKNPTLPQIEALLTNALYKDGYVVQEKIILPPQLAKNAMRFSAQSIDPARCNTPLVLIGHPDLPVQCASVIARSCRGRSKIEKRAASINVLSDEMNLLFSAPLLCQPVKSVDSFSAVFGKMTEALVDSGMDESAITRTWLFLDDILENYEILNCARAAYFARWHSRANSFIPASTGIGGHTPDRNPLILQFCAFSGNRLSIRQQSSPLQNEATSYGKLFSRCVVVELPRHHLVYISGTASIDKMGASVYPGNFKKQLVFTLEILSAILREVHGNFSHVAHATVYLKNHQDFDQCVNILDGSGFPCERTLFQLDTPVCRGELLCEIELTAVTT